MTSYLYINITDHSKNWSLYHWKSWSLYIYYIYIYIPRTQKASIVEGQFSKTRPFAIKTRVIWVLGIYIYTHIIYIIYMYLHITHMYYLLMASTPWSFWSFSCQKLRGRQPRQVVSEKKTSKLIATYCWYSKYPVIYRVLAPSHVVGNGISEPSTVSLQHQTFDMFDMFGSDGWWFWLILEQWKKPWLFSGFLEGMKYYPVMRGL